MDEWAGPPQDANFKLVVSERYHEQERFFAVQ